MAEIVNLRQARKARDRQAAQAAADANRAKHGLTKAEKQAQSMEAERAKRLLDQAKLTPGD